MIQSVKSRRVSNFFPGDSNIGSTRWVDFKISHRFSPDLVPEIGFEAPVGRSKPPQKRCTCQDESPIVFNERDTKAYATLDLWPVSLPSPLAGRTLPRLRDSPFRLA